MFRQICIAGAQTGALTGAGDLLAQFFEKRSAGEAPTGVDWNRTAKFASVGAFVVGPALRTWYGVLNRRIGSAGKAVALKKVLVDQCLFAPAFIATFLATLKLVEGKSRERIERELSDSYLDILKANYCLWPWVQLGNFYMMPLKYQVLTAQTVALFWNVYLSWKTHENHDNDKP